MASVQVVDDFQPYKGFIVKITMKETKEELIGWLGMLMSIRPATSQFAVKYSSATLTLVNDWKNYSLEQDDDIQEIDIEAVDVESIEILRLLG